MLFREFYEFFSDSLDQFKQDTTTGLIIWPILTVQSKLQHFEDSGTDSTIVFIKYVSTIGIYFRSWHTFFKNIRWSL